MSFLELSQVLTIVTLEAAAILPILIFIEVRSRDRDLRTALAKAMVREEELAKRLAEVESLNRELQKQLKDREEFWKSRLEEEVAKARKEALRLSKVADTLIKALKDGVVFLKDRDGKCSSVVVLPGKVLCREGGKAYVIWPERSEPGEEVIEVESREGK